MMIYPHQLLPLSYTPNYFLGNSPAVRWGLIIQALELQKEEKERAMNLAKVSDAKAVAINVNATDQDNHETIAREHLENRVHQTYYEKVRDARKKFFMDEDDFSPKNPKELIDRIKSGDFKFNKKYVNEDGTWREECNRGGLCDYYDVFHQIRWRTQDPDQKGFNEYTEKLDKLQKEAVDEVRVLPLEEGLKSLRRFQEAEVQ
jgi:hypothetical protein